MNIGGIQNNSPVKPIAGSTLEEGKKVEHVKRKFEKMILSIPGIIGVKVAYVAPDGVKFAKPQIGLRILVKDADVREKMINIIPNKIEGVWVDLMAPQSKEK